MHFINGTTDAVRVKIFQANAQMWAMPVRQIPLVPPNGWVELGDVYGAKRCDLEIGLYPHPDLYVYKSRSGGRIGRESTLPWRDSMGVPTDRDIILTPNRFTKLVDLTAVRQELATGIAANKAGGGSNPAVAAGLEAGGAIITALGTGIAALGVPGALPAGLIMWVGMLFLMLMGGPQRSGPPPLTEQQVHDIVTEVVRRELKQNDAETAAVLFASTTRTLLLHSHEARHQILDAHGNVAQHDLTPAERQAFEDFLRTALREGTSDSLHHHIGLIGGDPDRAKWILPAFIDGIGNYLTLRALNILRLNARPGPPPEIRVSDMEAQMFGEAVAYLRRGLAAGATAFEAMVTERIEAFGLQGTSKENEIRKEIRESLIGIGDLSTVDTALAGLGGILEHLRENPGGAGLSVVARS